MKKHLIQSVIQIVIFVITCLLLFQAGLSLDSMDSFETFFFQNRLYLFSLLGLSFLTLSLSVWSIVEKLLSKSDEENSD